MVKKEFTSERPKKLNTMSDVELIEELDKEGLNPHVRDVIRALLDKRTKISIQDLSEKIEKFNHSSGKMNKILIAFTFALLIIGYIQVSIMIFQYVNPILAAWVSFFLVSVFILYSLKKMFRLLFEELKDL